MLPLPAIKDHLKLADWLELLALASGDANSSWGDLESALRTASASGVESIQTDVFTELDLRAAASAEAYPFEVTGGVVRLRENAKTELSTYLFCLCLSYKHWIRPAGSEFSPARLFEVVCREAAARCINGLAVRFGSPRVEPEMPKSFAKALDVLCVKLIKEGKGHRKRPHNWTKDYGLDIVAWKEWPDDLPGKVMLFGACASGKDWDDKFKELDVSDFCTWRMLDSPSSQITRAFFIPHRVPIGDWQEMSMQAGLLFDRCRISHLVPSLPSEDAFGDGHAWIRVALEQFQTDE